ncbi:hypothetical protein D3C84_1078250 [compost metagenome]
MQGNHCYTIRIFLHINRAVIALHGVVRIELRCGHVRGELEIKAVRRCENFLYLLRRISCVHVFVEVILNHISHLLGEAIEAHALSSYFFHECSYRLLIFL